jgi:hypothetical protein
MMEYNNRLYLYGGLGCEKLLNWSCFDLTTRKWSQVEVHNSVQNMQSTFPA